MAFAEYEFARTKPTADGATEGDHVASALRQQAMMGKRKQTAASPAAPELPEALVYLWNSFIALLNGCASDGFGGVRVTWTDMQAWAAMTGNAPAAWEVDVLMRLANMFSASRAPKK